MRNLLSAQFARLRKDKAFWIGMAFLFLFGLYAVVRRRMSAPDSAPDQLFFLFPVVLGIVLAAFCSWFLGTEYSDGALRNKLTAGHARSAVYLSNFLVCSAAGLLMSLSYLLAVAALGLPVLGFIQMDGKLFTALLLISFGTVTACVSLFVLLGMSSQNKALSSVVCMLALVALFILAVAVNARLEEPEFDLSFTYSTNAGESPAVDSRPNPAYLRGAARDAHQFILDLLPTGQALQLSNMSAKNLWQMPLYSLLLVIASTGYGVLSFRKKEIR